MGSEDIKRQAMNVFRMKLLGATVVPVDSGSKTLKDAMNEAMRDWVTNVENTFYIIGSVAGPHPYPTMVRDFNSVVGKECVTQMPEMTGRQPDAVLACVGGGSNAMGIFMITFESQCPVGWCRRRGLGLNTGKHAASLCRYARVLHGSRSYLMQDEHGQIQETHSISAGLDYPGVGPEHAWLKDSGRATYVAISDDEAVAASIACVSYRRHHSGTRVQSCGGAGDQNGPRWISMKILLVNLSGRGDKDIGTVSGLAGITL
jgi:tryptophan synthase beta chain